MNGKSCDNCREPLSPRARFCPACGQSVMGIRRPWLDLAREALSELLDVDGRMLVSFRLLLTRPGFLSREYAEGRRVTYTPPIRMYLVISLVFFLVLPQILPDVSWPSPEHKVSVDLYSRAMFLLLPLFAALLKLFYRCHFYLVHLVFTMHLFSALFVAFAVMLAFESLADQHLAAAALQVTVLACVIAYFITALHTAYRQGWAQSVLKFLGLVMIFLPILIAAIELASNTA